MSSLVSLIVRRVYRDPMVMISCVSLCSIVGLLGANVAMFLGLRPCMLCNVQRLIVFVIAMSCSLVFMASALGLHRRLVASLVGTVCFFVLASHVFAWYQFAVEKGYVPAPSICNYGVASRSISDVESVLASRPAPPCNKPAEAFLGFSIAEIALVGTGALAILVIAFGIHQRSVASRRF